MQRRALAQQYEARGVGWEAQAVAESLPIDRAGLTLHTRCSRFIARHRLRRGEPIWASDMAAGGAASGALERGWAALGAATGMQAAPTHRAVVTDALSFPLTAALGLRLAGVVPPAGEAVSLLLLGVEPGSELSGLAKWFELLTPLRDAAGASVRHGRLLFVGPLVPTRLHGSAQRLTDGDGRTLELSFLRGAYHAPAVQARLPPAPPHAACAFNSGLAEHVADWAPSLRPLLRAAVPLVFTSYHAPEAELDARTLRLRLGCRPHWAARPNPFASQLPHLDELFPGRVYRANAFLTVVRGGAKACN